MDIESMRDNPEQVPQSISPWRSLRAAFAGVRPRLLALVSLPVVIAALYVAFIDERFEQQAAEEMSGQLRTVLRLAEADERSRVELARGFLFTLAALDRATNFIGSPQCQETMATLHRDYPQFQNFGLLDASGRIVCGALKNPQEASFAGLPFLRDAVRRPEFTVSDYQIGPVTGLPQIAFALPFRNADGGLRGVLFVTAHLNLFERISQTAPLPRDHDFLVVDGSGNLLFAYPQTSATPGKPLPANMDILSFAAGAEPRMLERAGFDGRPRLAAVAKIAAGSGTLFLSAGMPRERIDERAWALRRGELSALALIGLFGLFIAWQAGEIMLLDKIRRLRDAAAHWTAGDLSWRTLIRPGQGELRQLAGDLDAMAEALATLTHHHATLLNAAGEGIYGLDGEGKVTFVNPAAAALLGYRREELQGRNIAESIGPWRKDARTAVRVAAEFPPEIDPGQVQRLESLVFVCRDGTELPVDVARAPVHVHGRQVGVVDVFFDRRARDQAESALRQSEGRLRAIIEAAPDALFIVDAAGKITFANDQAAQLTGYPKRELLDRSVETLMPAPLRAEHAKSRDAFREEQGVGGKHARREVLLLRKDGSECIVEISLASFTADGGPQFVAMARDVSARKRVEADMRETNESLERRVQQRTAAIDRAYRDLESFSYSVAHDLRAPLRAINGFTHLVLEREFEHLSPSSRELFDRVVRNARKMDELIEDVLRYSRSTTQLAELVQVDMTQLAGQCVSEFQPQYPEARIDLQPLPAVRGDAAMLRQVWFNLIGNALKFSALRPEPKVEIGCRHGEECVFYVADNGIGFEMSQADKLFGMFQRLHAGDQFHGTGVGLAIVRRLLERQGGQIWAKSEPGRGATFYFTLGECIPSQEAPTDATGEIR